MLSIPRIDGGSTREDRALELYAGVGRFITEAAENTFLVPSQDGQRTYEVHYGPNVPADEESCTCPDHQFRGATCVHLLTVGIAHAARRVPRRRSHTFECACCEARHPLGEAVVVGADEAALGDFGEGELVCEPCGVAYGVA